MQERDENGRGGKGGGASYSIRFTKGKEAGEVFPLDEARNTIGRRPENTIVIKDIKVSGVHAEIVFEQGKPLVRDLGSTNGTMLDGKKITELILSEGDRITVGNTEFVLEKRGASAGPDVRAPESAQAVNGAEEEVRVIHDVRPARRGMSGFLLLLVLLLGMGGAGYYYFFYMSPESSFVALEPRQGNLIVHGWSFEEPEDGLSFAECWNLISETDAYFTRSRKGAHSGHYTITAAMPDGGQATATLAHPVRLKPRRRYTAAAWVKVSGAAMVGLKAAFYKVDENGENKRFLYREGFISGMESDLGYQEIRGTVSPPPEADELELVIVAAGKGEVVVDDVELLEKSSSKPDQIGTSGVMDFFSCEGGYIVRRIGRTLFLGGRVLAVEPAVEGGDGSVEHDSSLGGFCPDGDAYLYCGTTAGNVGYNSSIEVNADQIRGEFSMPPLEAGTLSEVRYCFDLLSEYAASGVGVLSEEEFSLYEASFPAVSADAFIFGGVHDRVKVSFARPVQVSGVERKDGGSSVQCVFDTAGRTGFEYSIKSDFHEEITQAQAMIQQVTRAKQDRRYGDSLDLIDQMEMRFPYNESVMDHASKLKSGIIDIKREKLQEIRENLKTARFLNTPELFLNLETACTEALKLFPGDRDFESIQGDVRDESATLLTSIGEDRAEQFYRIAENLFQAGGRDVTLAEVLRYLEMKFPDSEWTEKARSLGSEDGITETETETDITGAETATASGTETEPEDVSGSSGEVAVPVEDGSEDPQAKQLYLSAESLHKAGAPEESIAQIVEMMKKLYPGSEWTRKAESLGKEDEEKDGG